MLLCFVLFCFVWGTLLFFVCEGFYEILELKQRNSDLKNGDQQHGVSDLTESKVEIYTEDMDRTRSCLGNWQPNWVNWVDLKER